MLGVALVAACCAAALGQSSFLSISETVTDQSSPQTPPAQSTGGSSPCWCFSDDAEQSQVPGPRSSGQTNYSMPPMEMPYLPECGSPVLEPECWEGEPITLLGLRHSAKHGRNIGKGHPFVGTSWLNRRYFFGGALGTMWMTQRVEDTVGQDNDTFGYIFCGWDWDHYWGSELQVGWSTPELINSSAPYAPRSDRMSLWSYSHLHYFWGDSLFRPYLRVGIGDKEVSFTNDYGQVVHEQLLMFPIGIGLKYPWRPWLAGRIEFVDYASLSERNVGTLNDLTLTFSLEYRFGVHPRSYWPWYPSNHIK